MAYEKQIVDFAEDKATWVSYNELPLLHSAQLVRGWKAVTDAQKAANELYLNTYVSPKNATPSTTITNPQADGSGTLPGGSPKNEFVGLWRHVSTGWSRENQMYQQILRRGWASTLAQDECMVKSGSDQRDDARSYTFYWRNIASTAVDACVTGLRGAGSLVDPLVQGEVKTGTFAISDIVPEQQEDGSYIISVQTVKVVDITAAADLDALTPVRKDIHDINNPFGLEGRYDETFTGRRPTDGLVLTYRALSMGSRAAVLAFTDLELLGRLSVDERIRYRFVKRELTEDSGNTLTLVLVYQYVPLATTISEETARYVGMTRKNQSGKIIVEISWPRIDPDAMEAIMATDLFMRDTIADGFTVEGVTFAGEYFVNTTSAPMTDNDGIRIVQRMTRAGDQKLDLIIGKDPDHTIYEFFRWDISKNDIDEFMAQTGAERYTITAPAGGQPIPANWYWQLSEVGILKNVSVVKKEDESFDLHAIYSTTAGLGKMDLAPTILLPVAPAVAGTPIGIQDTYSRSTENAYGWNLPVAVLRQYAAYYKPSPAVVNQRNKFTISRQTEHVFDFQAERETFAPIDSGWVTVEDTNQKTVKVRAGAFQPAAVPDVSPPVLATQFEIPVDVPDNNKYERNFKKNEVGSYDGQIIHTVFYKEETNTVVEDDEEKTITRIEGKYLTAAEVVAVYSQPVADTPGTTVQLSPAIANDVGTFSVIKVTTVVKNQTNMAYEVDGTKLQTRTENTAAVTALATPAAVVGHIKAAVNVERPDGKVKTVLIDEEEKDQTAAGGEATVLQSVAVDEHTSSDTVPVPAAAQNVKVEITEAPTRGNRKRTKKVTMTARPWSSGAPVTFSNDGVLERKIELFKNQTAPVAAGDLQDVNLSDNNLGGFDAARITRALAAGASGVRGVVMHSVLDWQPEGYRFKTTTWTASSIGVGTAITGYNIWRASMSRWRVKTTVVKKSYSLAEPDVNSVLTAVPGEDATEGSGVSHSRVSKPVAAGLWAVEETTVTTGPWSPWGKKELTFLYWVDNLTGTGG